MNIIVCCKIVPEEQDIRVANGGSIDTAQAVSKISQYDVNAIQAAVDLSKAVGDCKITAWTLNREKIVSATRIQKDILSRGPDSLVCMIDEEEMPLPDHTSSALAEGIKSDSWDIILCGEGSGDLYAQQTGILLGEKLGVPSINAVSKIKIENGNAIVNRTLEDETEELEIPLPCVLSVTSDINNPTIPTMKAILGAGKKPVKKLNLHELGTVTDISELVSVKAPQQKERQKRIFESDSEENIAAFAESIAKAL